MYKQIDIPAGKIMLIDDHSLVLEGFKQLLLKLLPKDCEVHDFNSIDRAKANLKKHAYTFLVTDLMMPAQDVFGFITSTRKNHPNIIILIISSVIDTNTIKQCLSMGVNGYISKTTPPEEIKWAFENTFDGRTFVSSDISGRLANSVLHIEKTSLTRKELEVLRLIANGHKITIIAEKLYLSPITVMTHKRNMMRKLGIHRATELVKYAYDNHLV